MGAEDIVSIAHNIFTSRHEDGDPFGLFHKRHLAGYICAYPVLPYFPAFQHFLFQIRRPARQKIRQPRLLLTKI